MGRPMPDMSNIARRARTLQNAMTILFSHDILYRYLYVLILIGLENLELLVRKYETVFIAVMYITFFWTEESKIVQDLQR